MIVGRARRRASFLQPTGWWPLVAGHPLNEGGACAMVWIGQRILWHGVRPSIAAARLARHRGGTDRPNAPEAGVALPRWAWRPLGQFLVDAGQLWPEFGQCRPMLVNIGSNVTNTDQGLANSWRGQSWLHSGTSRPKLADVGQILVDAVQF